MNPTKLCSWCEHPNSEHHSKDAAELRSQVVGCLHYDKGVGFCRCSAERGRVRRIVKRAKKAQRKTR